MSDDSSFHISESELKTLCQSRRRWMASTVSGYLFSYEMNLSILTKIYDSFSCFRDFMLILSSLAVCLIFLYALEI